MTHPAPSQRVRFSVARLEAWAPEVTTADQWDEWLRGARAIGESGEPALPQMPAMLRRHVGRLGRLSCEVIYRALGDLSGVPIVFCSRYGELQRSVDLLNALARDQDLSPTSFGLSVHNAIVGLFAMARKETANTIAIAAGDESAEFGIIEACSLLADGAAQVLLVVVDCPLPSIYDGFVDHDPVALAWASLMVPAAENAITLEWESCDDDDFDSGAIRLPPAQVGALRFLLGTEREFVQSGDHRRWRWRRDA